MEYVQLISNQVFRDHRGVFAPLALKYDGNIRDILKKDWLQSNISVNPLVVVAILELNSFVVVATEELSPLIAVPTLELNAPILVDTLELNVEYPFRIRILLLHMGQ